MQGALLIGKCHSGMLSICKKCGGKAYAAVSPERIAAGVCAAARPSHRARIGKISFLMRFAREAPSFYPCRAAFAPPGSAALMLDCGRGTISSGAGAITGQARPKWGNRNEDLRSGTGLRRAGGPPR